LEGWRVVLYRQDFEKFSKISTIGFLQDIYFMAENRRKVQPPEPSEPSTFKNSASTETLDQYTAKYIS